MKNLILILSFFMSSMVASAQLVPIFTEGEISGYQQVTKLGYNVVEIEQFGPNMAYLHTMTVKSNDKDLIHYSKYEVYMYSVKSTNTGDLQWYSSNGELLGNLTFEPPGIVFRDLTGNIKATVSLAEESPLYGRIFRVY